MAQIYPLAYFGENIIPVNEANLNIATSAVLYGLSVYTVLPVWKLGHNSMESYGAFCLLEHYTRLINSAKIIGIDTFENEWSFEKFKKAITDLVLQNKITEKVFVRVTIHVSELLPGTRSRGLATCMSMFIYEALPIIPQTGARLKTSVWKRVPDFSIPSRAKVNGAYINSVLGKQDAIDSGYDDCLFLDSYGHICELSAANIFMIRDQTLITPAVSNDILEGINRKVIIEIAKENGLSVAERTIDLTEIYIADEVFACGTSSGIAPITEIDARNIGNGKADGVFTKLIKEKFEKIFNEHDSRYVTTLSIS